MTFTQISKHTGTIYRAARGEVPVIETNLEEGQYVTGVSLEEIDSYWSSRVPERKTVDWRYTFYVVTPL